MNKAMINTDFIVVGSGSAGSAIAYRLGEDKSTKIVVIEFGGTDIGPFIQMPSALSYPLNMKRYDWGFVSEPEPHLDGRRLQLPRGKVLGGSSSINGMVYVRGHSQDFDRWQKAGATGWGSSDVLPYFKRMEQSQYGDSQWRGKNGPLHVSRGKMKNPLYQAFLTAGSQAGYPSTYDYNGADQEGFCQFEMTIHNGVRWSTANAYLRPALKRGNVEIVKALAHRIIFDGAKAIGVEVSVGGKTQVIKASRGVIVSCSAFNSPAMLMRSGIGKAEDLKAIGIEVKRDMPGVGYNMQDHFELYVQNKSLKPITLNGKVSLWSQAIIGLQWLLSKRGIGASNHFEAGAFIKSNPAKPYPDVQFHFLPAAVRYDGKNLHKEHGYQIHVGTVNSQSRGKVSLESSDPTCLPTVQLNAMSRPEDWHDFRTAIRIGRKIMQQPAFNPYRGEEILPGETCQSDAELDQYIKDHLESAYHQCGTCKMGDPDDKNSVVDPKCKVIGFDNLWVADSSIFPNITYGNINAPTIMVGEKAADHILGKI